MHQIEGPKHGADPNYSFSVSMPLGLLLAIRAEETSSEDSEFITYLSSPPSRPFSFFFSFWYLSFIIIYNIAVYIRDNF